MLDPKTPFGVPSETGTFASGQADLGKGCPDPLGHLIQVGWLHNHGLAFASCFPASLLQVSTLKNVLPLLLTPVEPTWQVLLVASDDGILQELRWAAREIMAGERKHITSK